MNAQLHRAGGGIFQSKCQHKIYVRNLKEITHNNLSAKHKYENATLSQVTRKTANPDKYMSGVTSKQMTGVKI